MAAYDVHRRAGRSPSRITRGPKLVPTGATFGNRRTVIDLGFRPPGTTLPPCRNQGRRVHERAPRNQQRHVMN
jgi:hypothetical protein